MRHRRKYLWLEMKSACRCVLSALAGLIISIILLCLFIFGAGRVSDQQKKEARIRLAVVVPEDQAMLRQIPALANRMESVRQFASMENCNYDKAMEGFRTGDYRMVIVFPDDFFSKAEHMEEAEFRIYVHEDMGYAEKKVIAMIDGVQEIMLLTENSIKAMYDSMKIYNFSFSERHMEDGLLETFVKEALNRDAYYDIQFLSAYGDYSFPEYYASSVFLILVLMVSMSFFKIYRREQMTLERIMTRSDADRLFFGLMKIFSIGLMIAVMMLGALYAGDRICIRLGSWFITMKPQTCIAFIIIAFSLALYVHIFGLISEKLHNGSLFYILITLLLSLCSGMIVARSYYPEALGQAAGLLPLANIHRALLAALWQGSDPGAWTGIALWDLLLLAAGLYFYKKRLSKND